MKNQMYTYLARYYTFVKPLGLLSWLLVSMQLLSAQNNSVTIRGFLTNPKSSIVTIEERPNPLTTKIDSKGGMVNGDGSFTINIPLQQDKALELQHGGQSIPIYLQPGQDLQLSFAGGNLVNSIQYTGQSQSVKLNRFLANYIRRFKSPQRNQQASRMPINEFTNYMYNQRADRMNFLQDFTFSQSVPGPFADFMTALIDYDWAMRMFEYPFINSIQTSSNTLKELPPNYFDFLNQVRIENEQAVKLPIYADFLKEYIAYQYQQTIEPDAHLADAEYVKRYDFTSEKLHGNTRHLALAKVLLDGVENGKIEYIAGKYVEYLNSDAPQAFKDVVVKKFESLAALGAGNQAPDFTLYSADGKQISLQSLQGKVVYLDFWATWCGPCLAEMPHSKTLREKYRNKPVEFVYISIDEDRNSWISYLDKTGMQGLHLHAPGGLKSTLAQNYQLQSVPKYIIIGPTGNIVDSNAKKPSNKQVIFDLDRALSW